MADIIAIQNKCAALHLVKPLFDSMKQSRFCGTGQVGKPYRGAAMAIQLLPAVTRHAGMMPDSVRTFFHVPSVGLTVSNNFGAL